MVDATGPKQELAGSQRKIKQETKIKTSGPSKKELRRRFERNVVEKVLRRHSASHRKQYPV